MSESEVSRRKFLKSSVVGVGVLAAADGIGCGSGEGAGSPPAGPSGEPGMSGSSPSPGGGMSAGSGGMSPPAGQTPAPGGQMPPGQPLPPQGGQTPPGNQMPPPGMPTMPPPMGMMPAGGMGPGGMPLRALGKTGLMVSIVGFGSGSQYLAASEADAERMIQRAIELGINYFDTAASYGNGASQRRLGKYLVPMHRNKVVLVSKSQQRTAEGAKRELDRTLTELGTDHLDIFHLHEIARGDVDRILARGGALEVYQKAKEEGVIRFIGCSGHSSGAILVDALQRIKPDVIMCPQNAAREAGFTDMVIPYAQANGIGLLGMKVTAQDALTRGGRVKAEELVRYSLSLPVSAMIIGMSSLAVVESNASIAKSLQPLSPAQMMEVTGKLAALGNPSRCLPYRRWGYHDGTCWA